MSDPNTPQESSDLCQLVCRSMEFRKLEIDCEFRSYVCIGRWFTFRLTTVDDLGQSVELREASTLTLKVAGPQEAVPEFCHKNLHRDKSTVQVRFGRICSAPLRISADCDGCLSVSSHAFMVCHEVVFDSISRTDSFRGSSLDALPQRHLAFDRDSVSRTDPLRGTSLDALPLRHRDETRICISVGEDPRSSLVGAHAWEASIALAVHFASYPDLSLPGHSELDGSSCAETSACKFPSGNFRAIELGCGASALVGMVLGARGLRTIVSDREPTLLDLAQLNIDANGLGASVECRVLSWGAETSRQLLAAGNAFGLIVAADVLYCEDAYAVLVETLTTLCAASTSVVVISYKKREVESEMHFFHMMAVGFSMHVISTEAGPSGTCQIIRFVRRLQEAPLSCRYCEFLQRRSTGAKA